ncbi:MAG: biotin--[acetyl-CoA-carboxylase] ligase [Lachnospiraceae bacterium]|nr:biotin--[acetyl-CoA-carboxylase] ligase [Lachnospiraceae bacterium]
MKSEILAALRSADGYVSGQELCERFEVSRTAIWKAINQLKQAGYEIEAVQNKGYHMVSSPDLLSQIELESVRKTSWIGEEIHYFDTTDSTNTRAKKLAEEGSAHGTLVVADEQTGGRGRRGRDWESQKGISVYMSFVLKPEIEPGNASTLTLITALAVAEGIEKTTGLDCQIKWPNDVVVNGKKICGILTEMSTQIDYINYIVIGIGINVHNESFPEELGKIATSLYLESGKKQNRAKIIEAVLEAFEKYYEIYLETQDMQNLIEPYNDKLANMKNQVRVLDPKEPYEGRAMGITPKGELIVDTWEARKLVSSGEVSVRGLYGYT